MTDEELMRAALAEAKLAAALGEVPVGATPSCWPLMRPARRWAAGGSGNVSCS